MKKRCVRRDSNLEPFGHEAEKLPPKLLRPCHQYSVVGYI